MAHRRRGRTRPSASFVYDKATRTRVLKAVVRLGFLAPVAQATGISVETIRRWAAQAQLRLAPGRERIARSARLQLERRRARWAKVYKLKDKRMMNADIARKLGFRSAASITHILAQRDAV